MGKINKKYKVIVLCVLLVILTYYIIKTVPVIVTNLKTSSGVQNHTPPSLKKKQPKKKRANHVPPQLSPMVDWYYPKKNSQEWEEMFIRDFFQDKRGGFYVDVGASHYRELSTTYYINRHLGWRGIAIDAISEYSKDYEKYRPKTNFFSFFVSDKTDESVNFHVIRSFKPSSSFSKKYMNNRKYDTIKVKTITLNDLLDSQGVKTIDLLSMDIELAEPAALRGFDIKRFKPKLVVIETLPSVKDQVIEYLIKHGYVNIKRYTDFDTHNSYFTTKELAKKLESRKNNWED